VLLTDLRTTGFAGVSSHYFRLFTPVKLSRRRLPTSLPEFHELRHAFNLSDSPITAASILGGHWSDYNLAAILHIAACNLRCNYCYVEHDLLSGHNGFLSDAEAIIQDFALLRQQLAVEGKNLSMLRLSGGEPMLVPKFIHDVVTMAKRQLQEQIVIKSETNLVPLAFWDKPEMKNELDSLCKISDSLILHATIHHPPGTALGDIELLGLSNALEHGINVFPAIGGADWTEEQLLNMYYSLRQISTNLPLRLAVRPFQLDYDTVMKRGVQSSVPLLNPSEYWESLLLADYGVQYLFLPRHSVMIGGSNA
jgi:uncharacterized Fe-S cluster-containing radical SAM superfamily protein